MILNRQKDVVLDHHHREYSHELQPDSYILSLQSEYTAYAAAPPLAIPSPLESPTSGVLTTVSIADILE
jgi:hypothetical protein